jgi:hypothetical protein
MGYGTSLEIEVPEQVDNWHARTRFDIPSGNFILARRPSKRSVTRRL